MNELRKELCASHCGQLLDLVVGCLCLSVSVCGSGVCFCLRLCVSESCVCVSVSHYRQLLQLVVGYNVGHLCVSEF